MQVEPSYLTDLTSRIRAINDMASISATRRSQVPVDYVLGVGGFDLDKIGEEVRPHLHSSLFGWVGIGLAGWAWGADK